MQDLEKTLSKMKVVGVDTDPDEKKQIKEAKLACRIGRATKFEALITKGWSATDQRPNKRKAMCEAQIAKMSAATVPFKVDPTTDIHARIWGAVQSALA